MCPSDKQQIKNVKDILNYHLTFNILQSGLTILTIYTVTNIYFNGVDPYMTALLIGLPLITFAAYQQNLTDKKNDDSN